MGKFLAAVCATASLESSSDSEDRSIPGSRRLLACGPLRRFSTILPSLLSLTTQSRQLQSKFDITINQQELFYVQAASDTSNACMQSVGAM